MQRIINTTLGKNLVKTRKTQDLSVGRFRPWHPLPEPLFTGLHTAFLHRQRPKSITPSIFPCGWSTHAPAASLQATAFWIGKLDQNNCELSWICPHYTHHTHTSGLPDLCLCMSDHFYCPSLRLIQWWVPMVEMPILWFKRCNQIGSWRQSVSSWNIVLQYIQCVYTSFHFPFRKEDNSANRHVPFKILHFCKKHFKIMQFVAQPPAHHLKDGFGFWGWRETIQLWLPRSIVQHDDNTPYRNIIRLGLEG